MLDIVFVAHFAGSPRHGMVHAYYSLAREWLRMGHRVTIIAAGYAHTRSKQPDQVKEVCEEWIDGIRYLWIPVPTYQLNNYVGRALNILTFTARVWRTTLPVSRADLVICSSHHPFAIYPARKLAKRFGARLVFEVRDLWPLSIIELGGASRWNPFIMAMQFSENYAYRKADKIVSVLAGTHDYMQMHGMASAKFTFIPNGIDLSEDTPQEPLPTEHRETLEKLRTQGKFLVGFAGRVNLATALHCLITALAQCRNQRTHVVILGDGSHLKKLKEHVSNLSLIDRVTFLESVSKSKVQDFLQRIDVAYLGLQKQPLFRFGVSPTKLNDYMLAAKPIIYAIDAPGDVVKESGAGISCPAESADAICKALTQLSAMPSEELAHMGERGRHWLIENRDYRKLAAQFIEAAMD